MGPLGDGSGLQAEINVTPLVDVVLVLLIIFMVIVPLTLHGYDVKVPAATVTEPVEPERESIVLAFDPGDCPIVEPLEARGLPAGCRVRLADASIPVGELAERIGTLFAERPIEERVLFVAADEQLNYEGVMRILDLAQSGVEGLRIGMVSERAAGEATQVPAR